jgi:rare lipoprotein A
MKVLFIYFLISTVPLSTYLEGVTKASYYHDKFNGRKTASGEVFDNNKLTAAHKSLKFGTIVKVTNIKNSKSVEVRIIDRGPFVRGREIDLSKKAFNQIGSIKSGILEVTYTVIKKS